MKGRKRSVKEEINLGISNDILAVIAVVLLVVSTANTLVLMMERGKQAVAREPRRMTGEAAQGTAGVRIMPRGCFIDLGEKWNFISLCADAENTSIESVMQGIGGKYSYILEWDEAGQDFKVYSSKSSSNPFEEFNKNKSYFIYMDSSGEVLQIIGSEYDDVNLSLVEAWNDPFYPYIFNGNVSLYLEDLGSDYEYMMKWGNTGQEFYIYSRKSASKPFNIIEKGEGQMLYITNPAGAFLYYNKTRMQNV